MTGALRLFVAAYPPGETLAALGAMVAGLPLPSHRLTPAEQVHLTLQFVGDTDTRHVPDILESVERACAGLPPVQLRPTRVICLPERGRARLIAVETDAPGTLLELHRRLAHRLARHPRGRDEERFLPHLTLARFPAAGAEFRIDRPISVPPFDVTRVLLMKSVQLLGGVRHDEVGAFELRGR